MSELSEHYYTFREHHHCTHASMSQLHASLLIREIPTSPANHNKTISNYDLERELLEGPPMEIYDLKELKSIETGDSNFGTTNLKPSVKLRNSVDCSASVISLKRTSSSSLSTSSTSIAMESQNTPPHDTSNTNTATRKQKRASSSNSYHSSRKKRRNCLTTPHRVKSNRRKR
ncbi:hypothetical protein WDU94_004204 [Cyamophila willieti]